MASIDQISRGIVRRIMVYGAIVQLDDGVTGLVHISEIANSFVKDVRDYCIEGAPVVVQVLRQKEDGRWEFSMKTGAWQRGGAGAARASRRRNRRVGIEPRNRRWRSGRGRFWFVATDVCRCRTVFRRRLAPRSVPKKRAEFDEKLRDFLTDSSDRIEDVKRHHENRLGGKRR